MILQTNGQTVIASGSASRIGFQPTMKEGAISGRRSIARRVLRKNAFIVFLD